MGAYKRTLRYDTPTEQPLGEGARRRRRIECLEEALSSGAVIPITARRHFLASSSRAQPRDLCCTRMRCNEQAEKQKHGIAYDLSSPLETGVPQRDFRVWLHPKRRLACPLRRLPMKPNGPRRRRRIECLEEAPSTGAVIPITARRHFPASSSRAQPRDLCLTRMRVNAQEEKRKHGITCHTSRPLEKGRAEGAGWIPAAV